MCGGGHLADRFDRFQLDHDAVQTSVGLRGAGQIIDETLCCQRGLR